MSSNEIIFIVGPTAVGKTNIAFSLTKKFNGEIISCDSMQVYKEADIASSKPSPKMLKEIPHYLINEVSVTEEFNVAMFNQKALAAIEAIQAKKKTPVIVGGSGLYMQILLDGIFEEEVPSEGLRAQLKNELQEKGVESLLGKLKTLDPTCASKIHPHDGRRIVRALEICLTHARPASEVQKQREGLWGNTDVFLFAIDRERKELYARINHRVDVMFKMGLIEEIRKIKRKKLNKTAGHIIGIKEVGGYLQGEYDMERAKYLMKRNTRHFAKRQLTWFRKDKRLMWLMVKSNESPQETVERICQKIKEKKEAL